MLEVQGKHVNMLRTSRSLAYYLRVPPFIFNCRQTTHCLQAFSFFKHSTFTIQIIMLGLEEAVFKNRHP